MHEIMEPFVGSGMSYLLYDGMYFVFDIQGLEVLLMGKMGRAIYSFTSEMSILLMW